MSVALLAADQAAFVEAVARRVVELLDERDHPTAGRLVDAGTLARLLGVARSTVYDHAAELGAMRLTTGRRRMVRFDVERARAAWTRRDQSERSDAAQAPVPVGAARRRRATAARSGDGLLPITGSEGPSYPGRG